MLRTWCVLLFLCSLAFLAPVARGESPPSSPPDQAALQRCLDRYNQQIFLTATQTQDQMQAVQTEMQRLRAEVERLQRALAEAQKRGDS